MHKENVMAVKRNCTSWGNFLVSDLLWLKGYGVLRLSSNSFQQISNLQQNSETGRMQMVIKCF